MDIKIKISATRIIYSITLLGSCHKQIKFQFKELLENRINYQQITIKNFLKTDLSNNKEAHQSQIIIIKEEECLT